MKKKAQKLIKVLKEKRLTLALAESVTGGLAAHRLSGCSGASEVLQGAVVCYTPEVKTSLMKIPQKMIEAHTCESGKVTEVLAQHLTTLIKADIHAAMTGLASSGGSETEEKPVGTVFFSIRCGKRSHNHRQVFRGTPLAIKKKACVRLYELILTLPEVSRPTKK